MNIRRSAQRFSIFKFYLIAFLLIASNSAAQRENLIFRHITSTEGLSQNHGLAIAKDHKGFMWFGTQDGLNKYDGYKIVVYKFNPSDPFSISNNFINKVYRDKKNNLWIGTNNGLNLYDRLKDGFIRFVHDDNDPQSISGNKVNDIYEDSEGNLWIGTQNGLNFLNPGSKTFTYYQTNENTPSGLSDNHITALLEDKSGNFWVGTYFGGLNLFDRNKKTFRSFQHDPAKANSISNNRVSDILEDHLKNLWVSTDGGVNVMDRERGTFVRYKNDPNDKTSLGNDATYFMLEDRYKNLWIGTMNGGLNLFHRESGSFTRYMHDKINKNSISNNTPSAIFEDEDGTIWVGVHRGGINYFNIKKEKFKTFQQGQNENSLTNNNITSFYEDKAGKIWIGTDGGGLNVYDRTTNQFSHFRNDRKDKTSLGSDVVLSVLEDANEDLWIGLLTSGLNRYDRKAKKFIRYTLEGSDLKSTGEHDVWSMLEDDKNNIWIGSSSGLRQVDKNNGRVVPFNLSTKVLNHDYILCIFQDSQKGIWLGSLHHGVHRFDPASKTTIPFNPPNAPSSLQSERINVITGDDQGNIWIGGYNGLYHYNLHSKKFRIYNQKDGLPTNVVKSIISDNNGDLWICTLKGMSKFDSEKGIFINYTELDGLQSDEFTQNSFLKTRDGELYVGGINGFNSFYPDSVKENDAIPPVVFTDLKVFNKSIQPGEEGILSKHISETDCVTLPYDQSVFTFEFAALNFLLQQKNQYAYKLDGFDKQWNFIGGQKSATYTNLDPGEYMLRVKASNNDGVWNEEGASIKLIITPPFWLTWWFKTLAGILFAAGLVIFYRVRVYAIQKRGKMLERQVLERTKQLALSTADAEKARQEAEHANRAKSVFLATMSHEIRTPMNGVLGMAGLLAETSLSDEQRDYTNTIQHSGETLLGVINDILDFSKIESGKMELENKDFNLRDCIEEVFDVFAAKASKSGVDLIYEIAYNVPAQIVGDSLRLRQVLINLVSNAIKFTHQGEIFLGVRLHQQQFGNEMMLAFEVRDTGIGIPSDKVERLFKAFSQVDSSTTRKYGGTGLGLAISEKLIALMGGAIQVESQSGIGTTFTFTIHTVASIEATKSFVHINNNAIEGKRILVVDDNDTNCTILKNQLEQWRLVPTVARSAKEAIRILSGQEVRFEMLLTDMHMPEMDGNQLAQYVHTKYPELPIILLSSIGDERGKLHADVFSAVLTKPVKQQVLYKHILQQFRQGKQLLEVRQETKKLSQDFSLANPLNILIAEDNPVNQKLAERVLIKLGYKPDIAATGLEVLDSMKKTTYDLIFMDVQMPEMDGMEATRRIRLTTGSQPIIIAMTANAMQGDREACLEAGMDDYISKPIRIDNLVSLLELWTLKKNKKSA